MRFKPAIVWNPQCVPPFVTTSSQSWRKPLDFITRIVDDADKSSVIFKESKRVSPSMLKLVHNEQYVDDVLNGVALNGFGIIDSGLTESCMYTCGAMIEAVALALDGHSVCAPVTGFNHAGWAYGKDGSTFNGLALAAVVASKIVPTGVFDSDMYFGDGTVSILSTTGVENIRHYTYGGTSFSNIGKGEDFIRALPALLERVFGSCKLLVYQASADVHSDFPISRTLSPSQVLHRDEIVFQFAKEKGIPVVWSLSGGYSSDFVKALDLHEQTYNAWLNSL